MGTDTGFACVGGLCRSGPFGMFICHHHWCDSGPAGEISVEIFWKAVRAEIGSFYCVSVDVAGNHPA